MNLSDIFGKRVVSLKTATVFGTICGVHINKTTYVPEYISLSDDGTLILAAADMYGIGDVVSTFAEPRSLTPDDRQSTVYLLIGAETFDAKGKFLGKVSDYSFGENKNSRILTTTKTQLHPKKLIAANGILIFNTGRQLPHKKRAAHPEPPTANELPSPAAETAAEAVEVRQEELPEIYDAPAEPIPEPPRQNFRERSNTATISPDTLNFDFLLGRTTKRNISDLNGLMLIPIGTIISRHIIENARKNGKLSELAISSR